MIIVGERRFRASQIAGLRRIPISLHIKKMTPYEKLRRQMSENLHQSAAKKGESMNPIDTAKGWAKLYELKTDKKYYPGIMNIYNDKDFREIAAEVGTTMESVNISIKLLEEPEIVQQAIINGLAQTHVKEANQFPVGIRQQMKEKIIAGNYQNRDAIRADVQYLKKFPEQADALLKRRQEKESKNVNIIMTRSTSLGLALGQTTSKDLSKSEAAWVRDELKWLQKEISKFLLE
jgi:hypothetical protein